MGEFMAFLLHICICGNWVMGEIYHVKIQINYDLPLINSSLFYQQHYLCHVKKNEEIYMFFSIKNNSIIFFMNFFYFYKFIIFSYAKIINIFPIYCIKNKIYKKIFFDSSCYYYIIIIYFY